MSLGKRVKEERKKLGYTQIKLSEVSGITQQTLQKIEDGIADYDKAIQINSNFINARYNRGLALKLLGKNTKNYGIEKFHLLNKEYYGNYIPNENMSKYPEFSIHGMGITINIKKNE